MYPRLPQELVEIIIDHLQKDITTLKQCSLVHRSWLPRSRLHLFSSFTWDCNRLEHDFDQRHLESGSIQHTYGKSDHFLAFFSKHRHLVTYPRAFRIVGNRLCDLSYGHGMHIPSLVLLKNLKLIEVKKISFAAPLPRRLGLYAFLREHVGMLDCIQFQDCIFDLKTLAHVLHICFGARSVILKSSSSYDSEQEWWNTDKHPLVFERNQSVSIQSLEIIDCDERCLESLVDVLTKPFSKLIPVMNLDKLVVSLSAGIGPLRRLLATPVLSLKMLSIKFQNNGEYTSFVFKFYSN